MPPRTPRKVILDCVDTLQVPSELLFDALGQAQETRQRRSSRAEQAKRAAAAKDFREEADGRLKELPRETLELAVHIIMGHPAPDALSKSRLVDMLEAEGITCSDVEELVEESKPKTKSKRESSARSSHGGAKARRGGRRGATGAGKAAAGAEPGSKRGGGRHRGQRFKYAGQRPRRGEEHLQDDFDFVNARAFSSYMYYDDGDYDDEVYFSDFGSRKRRGGGRHRRSSRGRGEERYRYYEQRPRSGEEFLQDDFDFVNDAINGKSRRAPGRSHGVGVEDDFYKYQLPDEDGGDDVEFDPSQLGGGWGPQWEPGYDPDGRPRTGSTRRATRTLETADATMREALRYCWKADSLSRGQAARLLGVDDRPSEGELREARRRLVLQWHPDRNEDKEKAGAALQLVLASLDKLRA